MVEPIVMEPLLLPFMYEFSGDGMNVLSHEVY
jgi:hypothetical protein